MLWCERGKGEERVVSLNEKMSARGYGGGQTEAGSGHPASPASPWSRSSCTNSPHPARRKPSNAPRASSSATRWKIYSEIKETPRSLQQGRLISYLRDSDLLRVAVHKGTTKGRPGYRQHGAGLDGRGQTGHSIANNWTICYSHSTPHSFHAPSSKSKRKRTEISHLTSISHACSILR